MGTGRGDSGTLEWKVDIPGGKSETLVPESGFVCRIWRGLRGLVEGFLLKIWRFLEKAWGIGVDEPRKLVHCLKVGLALSAVSLFYYMRPLYDGVGGNAMWAVMTVVVVFEYTVGATLSKSINRTAATFLAGSLGIGIHWVASQSGERFEPIILGFSVFILAAVATFSRFVPSVKARFDYGASIFILTFSLVSVSGYRVEKLVGLAHNRLSTIAIGTSLCIIISMLFCPIWAGDELHSLITRNLEKLSDSLNGCVAEYFHQNGTVDSGGEDCSKKLRGYKCVLNSKATEDSMANFAIWEPAHGNFNFRHPWKQYLKLGASMRYCACCIEALNGCLDTEVEAPEFLKEHLQDVCMILSSCSSNVLKELMITMKTMRRSSKIDFFVGEMNSAVKDLQNGMKSLPTMLSVPPPDTVKGKPGTKTTMPPLMEVLPLATLVSLLIEIAARIEAIVNNIDELACLAEFKPAKDDKPKQNQSTITPISDDQDHETMTAIQKV
ncbi:hypothetical protein AAG906_005135 [Vitis piasezkii]